MADIQLRFMKDMLVLSEPVMTSMERLGLNVERDGDLTLLLEPEVLEDAYKLDALVGAQCLVAPTATLTPARLAHTGMRERASELASAALRIVQAQSPQHILVELTPCGLPLDTASKASLNENADQYKRAALLFADESFDAFFLNRFTRIADLKCALIGMRKVSDAPIFASVDVDAQGLMPSGETLREAAAVMAEYGAQVAGFQTAAALDDACRIAADLAEATCLPMLAQLEVHPAAGGLIGDIDAAATMEELASTVAAAASAQGETALGDKAPYAQPEDMMDAACALRAAGVQFLRATGKATLSYTGALVAATDDLDVADTPARPAEPAPASPLPVEDLAAQLRAKVAAALN